MPSPERHPHQVRRPHVPGSAGRPNIARRPARPRSRLWIGGVRVRPDCRGPARLRWHLAATPFHVTVIRGRNIQRAHHCIHTTTELPPIDREEVAGLAVMAPTRTLLDVARFVSAATLTAALDGALRDGKTTEQLLHQRIVDLRSKGRYGIPKLIAVIEGSEASRGGHSWLERRYLDLCDGAGLPRPAVQQVLSRAGGHLVRVDCRFPGTKVVVELLGYRWHRTKDQIGARRRAPQRPADRRLPPDAVHLRPGHDETGRRPGPDSRCPRPLRSRLCVTAQVPGDLCGDTER